MPQPTEATLAWLRMRLASVTDKTPRSHCAQLARDIEAAGIELSEDGNWFEADDAIEKLGTPNPLENEAFHCGYAGASEDYWYGDDAWDYGNDMPMSTAEREGAETYRAVYDGLNRCIESLAWDDMPSVPSDDINAMARARAEQRRAG